MHRHSHKQWTRIPREMWNLVSKGNFIKGRIKSEQVHTLGNKPTTGQAWRRGTRNQLKRKYMSSTDSELSGEFTTGLQEEEVWFCVSLYYKASCSSHVFICVCVFSVSAGVGRTGTFIVIDAMIDMMYEEQKTDVFGFVSRIRDQRSQLVQTDVSAPSFSCVLPLHYCMK